MRKFKALTDTKIRSLEKPGRYADGNGLYLNIAAGGSKSWVMMWTRSGRRREMGLGSYPLVSLARARSTATSHWQSILDGEDPIAIKNRGGEPTFDACANMLIEAMESEWRNDKHRAQWRSTLQTYCKSISEKPVSTIETTDVLTVLSPIWSTKNETASRLRGRIERVLDFAKVSGWRTGENPAAWKGNLQSLLPKRQKLTRGHHRALPYAEMPEFMKELQDRPGEASRALEFLILTASRTGEVLHAQWSEIDFERALWVIPAGRMKTGEEHRVPLGERCLDILKICDVDDPFLFCGGSRSGALSNAAMAALLKRMEYHEITVHGFRSTFRDWAGDRTSFPREVAEGVLSHKVGSVVERAYRRGDALEKRRHLLKAWERYVLSTESSTLALVNG